MHFGESILPLRLYLVVQAVAGNDVVLQPQGDHGLDAALIDGQHPLGGLVVGVAYLFPA